MPKASTRRRSLAGLPILALITLLGCKDKQAGPPGPPPAASVTVLKLQPEPARITAELPGRTAAFRTAEPGRGSAAWCMNGCSQRAR